MGRNAFDTAVEVVSEGFEGEHAVAEWMTRIEALGQRYCALALDLILQSAPSGQYVGEEETAQAIDIDATYDPLFEGEFNFDGVPGEPVEY